VDRGLSADFCILRTAVGSLNMTELSPFRACQERAPDEAHLNTGRLVDGELSRPEGSQVCRDSQTEDDRGELCLRVPMWRDHPLGNLLRNETIPSLVGSP